MWLSGPATHTISDTHSIIFQKVSILADTLALQACLYDPTITSNR